jgi:hypothetical protein
MKLKIFNISDDPAAPDYQLWPGSIADLATAKAEIQRLEGVTGKKADPGKMRTLTHAKDELLRLAILAGEHLDAAKVSPNQETLADLTRKVEAAPRVANPSAGIMLSAPAQSAAAVLAQNRKPTISRDEFEALSHADRNAWFQNGGGEIVD